MITKRLKKRRKGANRLDLTDLKRALRDRRCWSCLGVVTVRDGESQHWELVVEDGQLVEILVDVVTQPMGGELTCRLGGMSSIGTLTIPAEGDEVAILVPEGRTDFQPTIVAILSSNSLPNPSGQGPSQGRTLVVNSEVLVHDGSGGAVELALKSDVQEVVDALSDSATAASDGGATYKAAIVTALGPLGSNTPTGTTVLKAK